MAEPQDFAVWLDAQLKNVTPVKPSRVEFGNVDLGPNGAGYVQLGWKASSAAASSCKAFSITSDGIHFSQGKPNETVLWIAKE